MFSSVVAGTAECDDEVQGAAGHRGVDDVSQSVRCCRSAEFDFQGLFDGS